MAKGKLRKLFTNDDVLEALRASSGSTKKAARILTDFGRGKVSKQLLTTGRSILIPQLQTENPTQVQLW